MADGFFENIYATGSISAVGNVSGNYILGNGSQLSGLSTFASVTAITDQQFVGDGTTSAFILSNAYPANSCFISINGVLQIPSSAYFISGTTLTFVAPPSVGDLIDVRGLTTAIPPATYGNANVAAFLPTYTGNVSGAYFIGNGSRLSNVTATSAGVVTGNIQPNITSLGVLNSLSVFGTTSTWDLAVGGAVSAGGNVTGNYFIGDGSQLVNVFGGPGSLSRVTLTGSTGVLSPNGIANITIAGFKGYNLYGMQTSQPAWVTVYSSVGARLADASRPITTNPTPNTGVVAQVITTDTNIQYFTPGVIGFSTENPPSTNIQLKVVNTGVLATPIVVELILVKTEN